MQSDEPTIITSLEAHLEEYGHETVGQDIAAAILVIRDLHAKAALSAAEPSVAVKALEWEGMEARGVGSQGYWIVTGVKRHLYRQPCKLLGTFDTIKEAKAAARADYEACILSALTAQVQDVAGWQPIETAPHDTNVLLAWTDSTLPCGWKMEAGMASWGWRRDGVSNMSEHGQATHWMPLPAAPAKQESGK